MHRNVLPAAIPAAFCAGLAVARIIPLALAQPAPLQPQIVDLAAMTDADISAAAPTLGTLRSRTFVVLPQGTVSVQVGNVPKHMHADANEFQYVVSGAGKFWLGDQMRDVHAGDLIIIPKGTPHAGSIVDSGELKVLVVKMPPQAAGDFHLVP